MKVLVTGGAGFIGSHLVDRLLERNYEVVCIDNLLLGKEKHLSKAILNKSFKFYNLDILNLESLNKIFMKEKFEIVFHLAANSDIQEGIKSTDRDLKLTFLLTYNILECMRRNKVYKILFTSSPTVFGNHDIPLSEDLPMRPESLYGASKLASEAYIRAFSALYNVKGWILRLSNMVGERATHGILFDFIKKIKTDSEQLVVLGNGKQNKPYMYVHDLIDAIFFILENSNDNINTFNVGPKDGVKVSTIARIFVNKFGNKTKIKYTGGATGWKGDVPYYSHNSKKLNSLGWEPSLSSKEAIKKAIDRISDE